MRSPRRAGAFASFSHAELTIIASHGSVLCKEGGAGMSANSIAWRLVRRPVVFLGALGLVVALGFLGLFLSGTLTQASHATFTVNSTGDAIHATVGDATCATTTACVCTPRAAIE